MLPLPLPFPRVKICCIASEEEAWMAIRAGASALGLVGPVPSGPGAITEEQITAIATRVPPGVATFLLTSHQDAGAIIEQQKRCRTSVVQILDRLVSGTYEELRAAMPGIGIVQAVHVMGDEAIDEAIGLEGKVDAVLLDSGNPNLPVKELGGTGRTHDWQISARLCERVRLPVYLAGGLRSDNLATAIRTVRPFGVDLCNGVRTDGKLDPAKLEGFFAALRAG
ncbi:phosphoribosylanthranilate isomerase [Polyangium mundeleinium]|uniref:N-(5'-phosphoribosyl)anthranilate isomerase n=1 Tax=Polyangium mundeleinium TaxID=2995306 RepID=A0ABT5EXS8_9BACT|nr:phosphoribosylanthranilate isomerase [Polyangium mundeleinium]MDC0745616.1 phosphoribosylanthranilate isomerase [Polyangium mundeleinium]